MTFAILFLIFPAWNIVLSSQILISQNGGYKIVAGNEKFIKIIDSSCENSFRMFFGALNMKIKFIFGFSILLG